MEATRSRRRVVDPALAWSDKLSVEVGGIHHPAPTPCSLHLKGAPFSEPIRSSTPVFSQVRGTFQYPTPSQTMIIKIGVKTPGLCRGATVANAHGRGRTLTDDRWLITQRSQVQILPPLQKNRRSEA